MIGGGPIASTPIAALWAESAPDFPVRTLCMNAHTRIGFLMRAQDRAGFQMNTLTRKGFTMKAHTRGCC